MLFILEIKMENVSAFISTFILSMVFIPEDYFSDKTVAALFISGFVVYAISKCNEKSNSPTATKTIYRNKNKRKEKMKLDRGFLHKLETWISKLAKFAALLLRWFISTFYFVKWLFTRKWFWWGSSTYILYSALVRSRI